MKYDTSGQSANSYSSMTMNRLKNIAFMIGLLFLLSACSGLSTDETDCTIQTFSVNVFLDVNDSACDSNHCSLREAVIAANTCTDFDHYNIELPAGTYTLTIRGPEDERGDLDITRDTNISRSGSGAVIITGEESWIYRIFEIHPNVNVNMSNLTVSGGNSTEAGGGVYNSGVIDFLAVSLIENQSDQIGGGLYNDGRATLTGAIISDNQANTAYQHGCGGGAYNSGEIRLDFSTIINNNAYHGSGICNENGDLTMSDGLISENGVRFNGLGGGIYSTGGLNHLENVEISSNVAEMGGGLFFTDGELEILYSTITLNRAWYGGGVYLGTTANADLDFVSIHRNNANMVEGRDGGLYAGDGAGMYITTNHWDLYKSPITNNQALNDGGGIYIDAEGTGQGNFSHDAIAYNTAPLGAGAGIFIKQGEAMFSNTTISNNDGVADGVALYNGSGANTRLVHVTISDNNIGTAAPSFSEEYAVYNESGGTVVFRNSLVMGIEGLTCTGDEAGYSSEGGNVAEFATSCNITRSDDFGLIIIPSGGVLLPLMEVDGTLVHVLTLGSDAIDFVATSACNRDDQRLASRLIGANCDSGAFEWDAETMREIITEMESDDKEDGDKDESDKEDDKSDSPEPQACEFISSVNLFCRTGPGAVYLEIDSFVPLVSAPVLGISPDGYYVQVAGPNFGESCYVPSEEKFGELTGACDDLAVLPVPPTPRPTSTPTNTPQPAQSTDVPKPQPTPTCDQNVNCQNQP